MDSSYFTYHFGVEIELLLSSRSKNHKSWSSLASELSTRLTSAGISNHLNEDNDSSPENYTEWSITREVTIPSQMGKKLQWGIELVSPVFTATDGVWAHHINCIFRVLAKYFTITPSSHCSTHVHLSTTPPLHRQSGDLASVAKAILHFESALDSILPADRASSYWCQSNRSSTALKGLSLPQCFEYLDACAYQSHQGGIGSMTMMTTSTAAAQDIVRAMCLYPASSAYGQSHGYTEDFVHGVYKWDFSGFIPLAPTLSTAPSSVPSLSAFSTPSSSSSSFPLASASSLPYTSYGLQASSGLTGYTSASTSASAGSNAKGTLEFRQAPGSQTAEEARAYVELAVSFVAGAIALGFGSGHDSTITTATATGSGTDADADADAGTNMTTKHGKNTSRKGRNNVLLEDMWWLLSAGAQSSGVGDLRGVERLFSSARGGSGRKGKK